MEDVTAPIKRKRRALAGHVMRNNNNQWATGVMTVATEEEEEVN